MDEAREEAFRNACVVWNAVDESKKQRITIPNSPMLGSTAMSHTGGENNGAKTQECEENTNA